MQTDSYKKRAVDVRRSARANLIEIRKARMARKSAISADNNRLAAVFEEEPSSQSDPTPQDAIVTAAAERVETDMVADEVMSAEIEVDEPTEKSGDIPEMDSLDELATKNAAMPEMEAEASAAPIDHLPQTEPADADAAPETLIDDWKSNDLVKLPGAGPGLIWMLAQCNIDSLATLATQNATDLTTRLGVVGQILDVGQWIAFAQENG